MSYLIRNPDASHPEIYPLKVGRNTIGRELDNDIVITDSSLSRHHAEITITDDYNRIKDLGSLNHSFVNNHPVTVCHIEDNDEICLGRVTCRFCQHLPPQTPDNNQLSIIGSVSPEDTRLPLQTLLQPPETSPRPNRNTLIRLREQDHHQQALDKLKILLEFSQALSFPEPPERWFPKLLDLIFEIMHVDRAILLTVHPETQALTEQAVKFHPSVSSETQFYSRSIINHVLDKGDAVLITDATADQRFHQSQSVLQHSIRASMCVPLKPRAQILALLYVDSLSLSHLYSQEDLAFLTALANQAAVALENAQLYGQIQQEAVMRAKLERFFPKSVRQKLQESGPIEIVAAEVTVLFADISDYTRLSSSMPPTEVIAMLNDYFNVMVEDIIFPYEGTLEKYVGDGLFAVWGAPYRRPDDADLALKAAVAMQQAVEQLNRSWRDKRNLEINIHIGLNSGPAAAGNIGSEQLIQYAVIGDTTNVCSRICNLAQAGEILISESTYEQLSDRTFVFEAIAPAKVKGKITPLQLYRVRW